MLLKTLINKSVYGTTGYINSQEDLNKLEQYIMFNIPVLREFKQILIATNYDNHDYRVLNEQIWKKYFPECVLIHLDKNRGRNFGTTDLDNAIFDWCKKTNENWLCKSDNDVILQREILDKEINEVDFYYINGIGYGGISKYDFDFDKIINEDFYPQTYFYFINVSKVDYLNDKEYINTTFEQIKSIQKYNGNVWEYIEGWSCEHFLKNCVIRNSLTKTHLVPPEKYINLLKLIKDFNIHDCSYKNIMIENVCHLQNPNNQVAII